MSVEENVAVVRSIYDAFNSGDVPALLAALAPDFTLVDVAAGQTFQGPEGFMQWVQAFAAAAPDSKTEVTNMIAAGDWVFTEHTGRGTHTGTLATPAGDLPPTQRSYELKFGEVFQLRDGKIVLMRAYWDTATLIRQFS